MCQNRKFLVAQYAGTRCRPPTTPVEGGETTVGLRMRRSRPYVSIWVMEIRSVRLSDAEVEPLLVGLSVEYNTRYGENIEMTRASKDEFDPPDGVFIVLMDGQITVAGGGLRRHNASTCEVKRMWTSPQYRRRGMATRVLQTLEDTAWNMDYTRLILETGHLQPEAEALYVRRGYARTEVYGHYPDAHAFSIDLIRR